MFESSNGECASVRIRNLDTVRKNGIGRIKERYIKGMLG